MNGRSSSVNISGTSLSNSHFSGIGELELVSLCWKELVPDLLMSILVKLNPPLSFLLQLTALVPPGQSRVILSSSSLLMLSPFTSSNNLTLHIFPGLLQFALQFSFNQLRVTGISAGAEVCSGGLV